MDPEKQNMEAAIAKLKRALARKEEEIFGLRGRLEQNRINLREIREQVVDELREALDDV